MLSARHIPEAEQDEMLAGLLNDVSSAPLGQADLRLLEYVVKLTTTPGAMTRADTASLRSAGFDDRAIHDICTIAAYFAFVNRIADGLGVELEGTGGTPAIG